MKVSYLGTTVLLFDDGKDQILFDAHVTRPSIPRLLLSKIKTDEIMVERMIIRYHMDRVKAIFVSHSHHDHVMDMPSFANHFGCDVYGSASTLNVGRGGNVPEDKLHEFVVNSPVQIGDFEITVIPSLHSAAKWYNNDLGQTIDKPLVQPAKKKEYREGGSYDFVVRHQEKTYLIRPSYNYIEGQLEGIHADVLFLGVGGLANSTDEIRKKFFEQTLDIVKPKVVIPLHWDNFFVSLDKNFMKMPSIMENTDNVHRLTKAGCEQRGVEYRIQNPLTTIEM